MIEIRTNEQQIGCIEDAMSYLAGYCRKHKECDNCKIFNPETKQCFLYDGQPPCDWIITKEGSD